jgi:hypothetical protein
MALSCCVQLGNRDAQQSQYSNDIKKNSVPLKEELTHGRASASRTSCDDAAMCAHQDAGNACAIRIGTRQHCRKYLCRSDFFDSRATHSLRDDVEREARNVVNGAAHGLRVANFARKIFSCSPACSLGRTRRNVTVVANHRRSIRNTSIGLRVSRMIVLRRSRCRHGEATAESVPLAHAIVRGRAWISGDR